MKLLFIENRYKTYFLDLIAAQLEKQGHEIYWIVQNPNFLPQVGEISIIPYPSGKDDIDDNIDLSQILESDRQLNFFNKKDTTYFYYYYQEIKSLIDHIIPDITFGESTVFHELLAIKICKERGLLFLHPTSCRYPSGRFSFYKFDTVEPFLGSKESLSKDEATTIINSIIERSSKPNYMKKVSINKEKIYKDKIKILKGFILGEKYNTPSPLVKFRIEKQKKQNILNWDSLATTEIDKNVFSILYPLHLQPEANIDVWGRPRRNQLESIKSLASNLSKEQILYIKPNPKSKYELSLELIKFIKGTSNVEMLRSDVTMDAIFNDIDLFTTVNGTIALECIFANKPILTLVEVFFNRAYNCLFMERFGALQTHISKIQNDEFPKLSLQQKIDFLNLLNNTSFNGVISDPYYSSYSMSEDNIDDVVQAFNYIIEHRF